MAILTDEDKVYLRRMSRFIQSLGKKEAIVAEYYYDDVVDSFKQFKEYLLNSEWNFTNISEADIPEGFRQIVSKVLKSINISNIFQVDIDDINQLSFELTLNCRDNNLTLSYDYYYYETDERQVEFPNESEVINNLIENGVNPEEDGMLYLDYSGGGDSGYINGAFANGEDVPADFEEWCYNALEEDFGGWEIDAGSQGQFVINFEDNTIVLNHGINEETSSTEIIFTENFSKEVES